MDLVIPTIMTWMIIKAEELTNKYHILDYIIFLHHDMVFVCICTQFVWTLVDSPSAKASEPVPFCAEVGLGIATRKRWDGHASWRAHARVAHVTWCFILDILVHQVLARRGYHGYPRMRCNIYIHCIFIFTYILRNYHLNILNPFDAEHAIYIYNK